MYSYGPPRMARQKQDDQLFEDTGCSPEDLPEAMNDREKWRERVRDIRASGTIYIYIYIHEDGSSAFGHIFTVIHWERCV